MRKSETLEGEDATGVWCFDEGAVSAVEVKFLVDFGAATRVDLVRDSRLFWTAAIALPVSLSASGNHACPSCGHRVHEVGWVKQEAGGRLDPIVNNAPG